MYKKNMHSLILLCTCTIFPLRKQESKKVHISMLKISNSVSKLFVIVTRSQTTYLSYFGW